MTRRAAAALLLSAPSLAGCGGGTITQGQTLKPQEAAVADAITGGVQPVEIHGAPPDGATPEEVAAALPTPGGRRPTTFEAVPRGAVPFRLVLEFGDLGLGDRPCYAPVGYVGGADLRVGATLCNGDRAYASALLSGADVAGPSDPGFRSAMSGLFAALLDSDAGRRARK